MKSNLFKYYRPIKVDWDKPFAENENAMESNWKQIIECDKKAKEAGTLLGRYFSEPVADGNAIYIITKVNKRTCVLEWCEYIGDDWQSRWIGEQGTVPLDIVLESINYRDTWLEMVTKKNETR